MNSDDLHGLRLQKSRPVGLDADFVSPIPYFIETAEAWSALTNTRIIPSCPLLPHFGTVVKFPFGHALYGLFKPLLIIAQDYQSQSISGAYDSYEITKRSRESASTKIHGVVPSTWTAASSLALSYDIESSVRLQNPREVASIIKFESILLKGDGSFDCHRVFRALDRPNLAPVSCIVCIDLMVKPREGALSNDKHAQWKKRRQKNADCVKSEVLIMDEKVDVRIPCDTTFWDLLSYLSRCTTRHGLHCHFGFYHVSISFESVSLGGDTFSSTLCYVYAASGPISSE